MVKSCCGFLVALSLLLTSISEAALRTPPGISGPVYTASGKMNSWDQHFYKAFFLSDLTKTNDPQWRTSSKLALRSTTLSMIVDDHTVMNGKITPGCQVKVWYRHTEGNLNYATRVDLQ